MKPLLTRVCGVLFDLDGTLVDTHIDFPLMKRRMIEMAAEHGMAPDALAGMDILAIVEAAASHLTSSGRHNDASLLRSQAMDILEQIELHHANKTQEIPFARELVYELKSRKIGVGIVTRNCRAASEISLNIANIAPDVLICREDTTLHKPHPEPVMIALRRLCSPPGNSIMIGDHIMDIQSGKAAGTKTIGFLREDRPDDFFDLIAPDYVARSLGEVRDAIIHSDR